MTKAFLITTAWTLLFMFGVGCTAYGLSLAYRPLGYVLVGLISAIVAYGGGIEQMGRKRSR